MSGAREVFQGGGSAFYSGRLGLQGSVRVEREGQPAGRWVGPGSPADGSSPPFHLQVELLCT